LYFAATSAWPYDRLVLLVAWMVGLNSVILITYYPCYIYGPAGIGILGFLDDYIYSILNKFFAITTEWHAMDFWVFWMVEDALWGTAVLPCCYPPNTPVASMAVMLAQIKHRPIIINNE
jgi:hypothetical protein